MPRSRFRLRALGVVMVVIGAAVPVRSAGADGIGDQQQQVKDDLARIDQLDRRASLLNEQSLAYLNQKAALDVEITAAQQQIAREQADLDVLSGQLADLAVEKLMGGGDGPLGPLFTDPAQIDAGLQRDELARVAVDAGAATTDDYATLLHQLDDQQKALEKKQQVAARLAKQASDASAQASKAGDAYQAELAKDQATLGVLLQQEQDRQIAAAAAQHAKDVAAAQAAEAAKAAQQAQNAKAAQAAQQAQAAQNAQASTNAAAGSAAGAAASSGTPKTPAAQITSSGSSSGDSGSSGASGSSSGSATTAAPTPPPVSSRAQVAVNAARAQLGVPYKFAMSSPGVAFDCSGLTAYAWSVAGVSIVHQSAIQFATTPHVPVAEVQPGDLLFFYHPISHVAIYIGNGQMIHAPAPGKTVTIANVNWGDVVGASRPG